MSIWKLSTLSLYSMNLRIPICLLKVTRSNHYHDALLCVQLIPVRNLCLFNKHIVTILLTKKAFLNLFVNYALEFWCWLLFCFLLLPMVNGIWFEGKSFWWQNYLLYYRSVKLQRISKWIRWSPYSENQFVGRVSLIEHIFWYKRALCNSGCSVIEGLSAVHCGNCKM